MDLPEIVWVTLMLALTPSIITANSTANEPFSTDDPTTEQTTTPEDTTPLSIQEDLHITDKTFSIEYQILDERIPKLMADLINANNFQYNITTQNLINILNFQHITFSNLTNLMDQLDIELRQIDYKRAFEALDLSIIEVLRIIVTNVPDAKSATPKILTNFGLDPTDYIWITNFENDTSMFNLLSKGSYTEENFAYALGLANMTEEDVLNLLRPMILQHLNLKNITDILGLMSQYDLSQRLDVIFEVLNITASSFYEDPIFGDVLSTLNLILNSEEVLAAAVQDTKLLSILGVHGKWANLDHFAIAYVSSVQNRSLRYEIEEVRNNSFFSIVSVGEVLGAYFRKAEYSEYTSEKYVDCQCVSKTENEFLLADIRGLALEGDVLVGSSNDSTCNLGSPLICSNLLYGLSINAAAGSPKFLTFRAQSIPRPPDINNGNVVVIITDPMVEESATGGVSIGGLTFLISVLQCFIITHYVI